MMLRGVLGSIPHVGTFLVPSNTLRWFNKACYPVCGMVHIKHLKRLAHEVAAAGFLSRYLNGPLPHVRRQITVNKMC